MTRSTTRPSAGQGSPGARALLALVLASLLALAAGACSGDSAESNDAQPAPEVSTFAPGGFDDVPRYRGSQEAGPRSEDGDVVSQSFFVEGADPQMVIDFYRNQLQGWEFSGERDVGDALTAEFTEPGEGGRRLEVSAGVTNRGGLDMTQTLQYSLVLHT